MKLEIKNEKNVSTLQENLKTAEEEPHYPMLSYAKPRTIFMWVVLLISSRSPINLTKFHLGGICKP